MAIKQYEIGYKQKFSPVEGTFYDFIFAPNLKIAKQTMYKIHGKKEIRITSVTEADGVYPDIEDIIRKVRTGRF